MDGRNLEGPARFFAEHPFAHALALAGAGTAAGVFGARAVRGRGPARAGWALLCALEIGILFGILGLRAGRKAE